MLSHFRRLHPLLSGGQPQTRSRIFQALIREVGLSPAHILFMDDKVNFVDAARPWPGGLALHLPRDFKENSVAEGLW